MTRRTPQYVRCGSCHHLWIGVWCGLTLERTAAVLESLACPMCGELENIEPYNQPKQAAPDTPPDEIAFPLTVRVDSELAADLKLFMGKVQVGDVMAATRHPRAVAFMVKFPNEILNAAGYARQAAADLSRKEPA